MKQGDKQVMSRHLGILKSWEPGPEGARRRNWSLSIWSCWRGWYDGAETMPVEMQPHESAVWSTGIKAPSSLLSSNLPVSPTRQMKNKMPKGKRDLLT